jgi:hypothetical protein
MRTFRWSARGRVSSHLASLRIPANAAFGGSFPDYRDLFRCQFRCQYFLDGIRRHGVGFGEWRNVLPHDAPPWSINSPIAPNG